MSRTFKDRPEWVQRFDSDRPRRVVHDHRGGRCVIETREDARPGGRSLLEADYPSCTVDRWGYITYCQMFGSGVPAWFVNHVWAGPSRRRARDEGRAAVKWLNAGGDPDEVDIDVTQHRHNAAWLWY